jgi:hypothetical protein
MAKDNKDIPKNQPHDNDTPSSSGIANKPDKSTTETQAAEQSITQSQKKIDMTNSPYRPGEKWVIGLTLAFDILLINASAPRRFSNETNKAITTKIPPTIFPSF